MRIVFIFFLLSIVQNVLGQGNPAPAQISIMNELPKVTLPTPEAAAITKADNLSIGLNTGTLNINIPLFNLKYGGMEVPITLNYASNGIKVDDYASIVGMGWTMNAGGMISRTVYDKPDENRDGYRNNLNPNLNVNLKDSVLYNFLYYQTTDRESDIFTFSFLNYSGKFIIGYNGKPVQLTKNNLIIKTITNEFKDGFIIITDNGANFYFTTIDYTKTEYSTGQDCPKNYDRITVPSTWNLTKIVLPNQLNEIKFDYIQANIKTRPSITQTLTKTIGCIPLAGGCEHINARCSDVGNYLFSSCISNQTITTNFLKIISTGDGDTIEFSYGSRTDIENGKSLQKITVNNRYGQPLSEINFTNTTYSVSSSNNPYSSVYDYKRLFLNGVSIKGGEISAVQKTMNYTFDYITPANLPARLSFGQDMYGFANGKNTNLSLIPKLPADDINYGIFNNGTGNGYVTFGDRAIDTNYAQTGLLKRINYPTGGYDTIIYRANRFGATEKLAGGQSVSVIKTYDKYSGYAKEKSFIYRTLSDNKSSAILLTQNVSVSQRTSSKTNSFSCSADSKYYFEGPEMQYATVTSNSTLPITAFGTQHLYYKSVIEKEVKGNEDIGLTEHIYRYIYEGTGLYPLHIMGQPLLNAPYQVVPDILVGEFQTNYYKKTAANQYKKMKGIERTFLLDSLSEFKNYVTKEKYTYGGYSTSSFPGESFFEPYDVTAVYINTYTTRMTKFVEKEFLGNDSIVSQTDYVYHPLYTYPTSIITSDSKNKELKVNRQYTTNQVMLNRNLIYPVMEEKTYRNNSLKVTRTQNYNDWFSDGKVLAPSYMEVKLEGAADGSKIIYTGYNRNGNIVGLSKDNDKKIVYIWDKSGSYPLAEVLGSDSLRCSYSSFEPGEKGGGWNLNGAVIKEGITGYQSFNGSATKSVPSGSYKVTAWAKGQITVNNSSGTQLVQQGGWSLYEWNLSPATNISVYGARFDELRLLPAYASMTTFCYTPLIGLNASCNENNLITYYEYDAIGRLALIRDMSGNILKKTCYNYDGTEGECDVYYNDEMQQIFLKNDCQAGYVAKSSEYITYKVPANKYSGYSKSDANNKAQKELLLMGQKEANEKGSCVELCSTGNCTGEEKKCINGICEAGIKVYTSSIKVHGSLWECTYHYEWSDNSWSPNYIEYSPTKCINIIY